MHDPVRYNSTAWDKQAESENKWTIPVGADVIAAARKGEWTVVLTPSKPVPADWFGDVSGKDVLCLASGGGQQAPVLAAVGAVVTSFDNSAKQLAADQLVVDREGLMIRTEQGDAADLSRFAAGSFDLIFHPCSNCFMPKLQPIWNECFRVLRPGGRLLVGFTKPEVFIFDWIEEERSGELKLRFSLPYTDETSLTPEELAMVYERNQPVEFSHTLEEQIGGQIRAGFHITGFYEDGWQAPGRPIDRYMPAFISTLAIKPR
jgi:SAM-dependent methyltransferase